jgi:hypothetical protein
MKIFGKSKNGEKSWKSMDIYGKSWIYTWGIIELKKSGKHNCLISIFSGVLYHAISRHLYMGKQLAELTRGTNRCRPRIAWFHKLRPLSYKLVH